VPLPSQQAVKGRVRDFVTDDPAFPEIAFPGETKALQRPGRSAVAGIDVGFDAIQVEFAKAKVEKRLECFVHVAMAPCERAEPIADFRAAARVVDAEERTSPEEESAFGQLDTEAKVIPRGLCQVRSDHVLRRLATCPRGRAPVPHHPLVGEDGEESFRVSLTQRTQDEPVGAKGEAFESSHERIVVLRRVAIGSGGTPLTSCAHHLRGHP